MSMCLKLKQSAFAASLVLFLAVFAESGLAQQPNQPSSVQSSPTSPGQPLSQGQTLTQPDASVRQVVSGKSDTSTSPGKSLPSDAVAGTVRIENLVRAALEANPNITALKREFDAARARIPQAKALPDPMVMIGNVNTGSPIPFLRKEDDFNENFNIGFSQDFPWFGIRRLRGEVASSEAEAKYFEYAAAVRQLTADVKMASYDLYYYDRVLGILGRDLKILKEFVKVAQSRYEVGKAQQIDIINARVEIAELLDKQSEIEAKRNNVAARINNLLYRDPLTPIGALIEIQMSPLPPSLEELIPWAMENAPELKRDKRMIDAGNHSLRLAEHEAKYPEVGLQFVYHNRTPTFPAFYSYQANFKLPLYAFNKQRYAIEEQSANLAAARSRLNTTNAMIRYKLRDALVRANSAARRIQLIEEGIIPQATLALESALSTYQVGQIDFLTLLTTLKRALDYETRYYEMFAEYQKALAEMEIYIGVELTK